MKIGILASGILGLKTIERTRELFLPEFIATDSKSEAIISYAKKNKVPIFKGRPNEGMLNDFLKNAYFDVIFSINYLFIIEKNVIKKARYAINFHGSLLPKYRGRTPHVWAIINNEKEAGVTAHIMDEGCDTGPIIAQCVVPISFVDTGASILDKYEHLYPIMIKNILKDIGRDQIKTTKQDHTKATYFGKRDPEDGLINWDWMKEQIYNWIRAQAYPYPGAYSLLDGEKVIIDKIAFSERGFNQIDPNGLIIEINPNPIIKTPNGTVELTRIRSNKHLFKVGRILK